MTSTAPAEIVSQCAPNGPRKRNNDVEITPRSSDGMYRNEAARELGWAPNSIRCMRRF
jgi:hypothetical protein